MNSKVLKKYIDLKNRFETFERSKIPLCAAETFVSNEVRNELSSSWEGKYSMGNRVYEPSSDFIGGEFVHELFQLINEECALLYDSDYADARTLSGMNSLTIAISSLLNSSDKVLITTPEQGGHPSLPFILDLLGIRYRGIPYDYSNYDIDYSTVNDILKKREANAFVFCQSDFLKPARLDRIAFHDEKVIYDASQSLGMIAGKIHRNPMHDYPGTVLVGGTHKTLPGPTCGLIMTKNLSVLPKLDTDISPHYLRNAQPNVIAGLLIALIEQEQFGPAYQSLIVNLGNRLGKELTARGLRVAKISNGVFTESHQIFILTSRKDADAFYVRAHKFGVTLNVKHKRLFGDDGIRIGLQEVARYGFGQNEIIDLADLIFGIANESQTTERRMRQITARLCQKKHNAFVLDSLIE